MGFKTTTKRLLLLTLIPFSLLSCHIEYDGETKLIIKGKLTDEFGLPLANQEIKVNAVSNTSGLIGPYSDLISYGLSDSNGNYLLGVPKPKSAQLYIDVNTNQLNGFQNKSYIVNEDNFTNFNLNLNTTLYKKDRITSLTITIKYQNPANTILKSLTIEGKQVQTFENLIPEPLDPNYFFPTTDYLVLKNQIITIKYEVYQSGGTIANLSVNVPIENVAINYVINI